MKSEQNSRFRKLGWLAKALVLWIMLVSGIVLATRQARAALPGEPVFQTYKI